MLTTLLLLTFAVAPAPSTQPATRPEDDSGYCYTGKWSTYYHRQKDCTALNDPEAKIEPIEAVMDHLKPCTKCIDGARQPGVGRPLGRPAWKTVRPELIPYLEQTLDQLDPVVKTERAKLAALQQMSVAKGNKRLSAKQDPLTGEIKYVDGTIEFMSEDKKRAAIANQLKVIKEVTRALDACKQGQFILAEPFTVGMKVGDIGRFEYGSEIKMLRSKGPSAILVSVVIGKPLQNTVTTEIIRAANQTTVRKSGPVASRQQTIILWVEGVKSSQWVPNQLIDLPGAWEVVGTKDYIGATEKETGTALHLKPVP